jgi:hypothetical protein
VFFLDCVGQYHQSRHSSCHISRRTSVRRRPLFSSGQCHRPVPIPRWWRCVALSLLRGSHPVRLTALETIVPPPGGNGPGGVPTRGPQFGPNGLVLVNAFNGNQTKSGIAWYKQIGNCTGYLPDAYIDVDINGRITWEGQTIVSRKLSHAPMRRRLLTLAISRVPGRRHLDVEYSGQCSELAFRDSVRQR